MGSIGKHRHVASPVTRPLWRRNSVSQRTAPATVTRSGSAPRFIHSQPAALTNAPDENDEMLITVNTMTSLKPCVFALSAGLYDSISSVVPPVYMKFQPTPRRTSAAQNCHNASPDR